MIEIDVAARAGALPLECEFAAETPSIVSLFGPSGAGKTTLLRVIAGLQAPTRGRIALDGAILVDAERGIALPPEARRIGYVFQDARLFPHLSVRENLLYGFARAPADARGIQVEDVVAALGIENLLARGVRTLSGGERQRIALGRALLAQPRLILMDEPLAGVDAARKSEILALIRAVQRRFGASILYVSHDLDEVAALADHVALIEAGRISAHGRARDLFADPNSPLAERTDARALIDGKIAAHQDGLSLIEAEGARLAAPRQAGAIGDPVRLQVFARDVTLALIAPQAISTRNILPAEIASMRNRGDGQVLVALSTKAGEILSLVTQDAVGALGLKVGLSLFALVKAVAVK